MESRQPYIGLFNLEPGKYLNDVQTFGNWKISFRIYFDMEIDNTMRLVDDGNFDSIAAERKKE